MVLLDLFVQYGPWAWFVLGLVLLALELVVPGGWFLWLGAAGIVTGLTGLHSGCRLAVPGDDLRRTGAGDRRRLDGDTPGRGSPRATGRCSTSGPRRSSAMRR